MDAVRVMPLAKRLNLSRTSFYWFYEDREQLLAALLARWRDKNTGGMVSQCESYAESISEAILNVFECWVNPELFDSQFEFAVRSWALQSDEVTAEIALADEARMNALAAMFRRFGYDAEGADVRARTIYLTQIGYISMKTNEDIVVRFRRIPQYVSVFTGKVPKRRELDRFYGKFGYAEKKSPAFSFLWLIPSRSPLPMENRTLGIIGGAPAGSGAQSPRRRSIAGSSGLTVC